MSRRTAAMSLVLLSMICLATSAAQRSHPTAAAGSNLVVDGSQGFQRLDGLGVNANSSAWNNGQLAPALDTLKNTLGVSTWRVIVESTSGWEETNPNPDPTTYNWTYYNDLYGNSTKFQALWGVIGHLEQSGASSVMVNVMGCPPGWMGSCAIDTAHEEDWVTMVTSMVYYAVNTKKLRIDILSPMNEQDTGYPEGPSVASGQYVRLLDKLSTRLDGLGLSSVRLLGPDTARLDSGVTDYMPRMQADAGLMAKVDHFGLHDYSGNAAGADQQIKASRYPAKNFWMTEFSSTCSGCDTGTAPGDEWSFAAGTAGDLLSFLQEGAASTLAYEGYDSYYEHHGSRSYWGLLAYDSAAGTYVPRSRFWALAQVYRFATPGSIRIGASSAIPGVNAVALFDPATGRTTVVGRNTTGSRQTVNGTLQKLPALDGTFQYFETTSAENMVRGADVSLSGGQFAVSVPPDSVFTLTMAASAPGPTPTATPTPTPSASPATLVGDTSVEPGVDRDAAGLAESFQYTATASGPVGSLAVYLDSSNTASGVVLGLYEDAGGHPGSLLTQGSISSPAAGWNTVSVPAAQVSAGARYWLALLAPAGGTAVSFRDVTAGGGNPAESSSQPDLTALPSTWSSGATWANAPASLYASVAPGGPSPTPTPTPAPTPTPTPTPTPAPPPDPTPTPPPGAPASSAVLVGSSTIQPLTDSNPTGRAEAFQFTAPRAGTSTTAWVYLADGSTASAVTIGVYADGPGGPGSLLTQSTIDAPRAGEWNHAALSADVAAGAGYWLVVLQPAGSSGSISFRDAYGGTSVGSAQSDLTALPSNWSPGQVWSTGGISACLT